MKEHYVLRGPVYLVSASLLLSAVPSRAQTSLKTQGNEIVGAIAGVSAAIGVGVGVGVYFALHPKIKGCVSSDANGLEITDEKDHAVYQLTGATSGMKAGEVVSVRGKKKPATGGSAMGTFRVDSVKKTWGECAAPSTP